MIEAPKPSKQPNITTQSEAILTGIWATLSRGVADTKHDWHWPVLGTVKNTANGPSSSTRVVVLRAFSAAKRLIEIHSDSRAQKIIELQDPSDRCKASLLFYDSRSRTQLRIQASATVSINDAISQAAWAKLPEHGRTQYLGCEAPGSKLPDQIISSAAPHFAVIQLTIESIDWLVLARDGHQRMRFVWDAQTQQCAATALVP